MRPGPDQLTLAAEIRGGTVAPVPRGRKLRALAGCVVLDPGGRVLLLHRKGPREQWEMPGGKVDERESSEDAACRELHEELGLEVLVTDELGDARFREQDVGWRYTWYLAHAVLGTPVIREPDRFDDLAFFQLNELVQLTGQLSPNVRLFVMSYFEGRVLLPIRPGQRREQA